MNRRKQQKGLSFLFGFGVIILFCISAIPTAASERVNKDPSGVAIKGYDTVAYHTEGRALEGKQEFSYAWNDAVWYFANEKNRDLFAADPQRYAPQYGGF